MPTALITGATDGHGRRVALDLAAAGWRVIVHGRDRARGKEVVAAAGAEADLLLADLGSLAEARRMAEEAHERAGRIDVLVSNAGIVSGERRESRDGIELQFAVNYLAHVVITDVLLERDSPGRIVHVSSLAAAPIDPDDPLLESNYDAFRAYGQSKLAQVMHAFDLAERLDPARTTANALHPATLMDTTMVRQSFGRARSDVREGAAATVRLVADPALDGVSGRFFDGQAEARAHRAAYDPEARRRLRELTSRLTMAA